MRKILAVICSFIIVFAFCSAVAFHPQEVQAGDCDIYIENMKVSPHSLILHSKGKGDSLTIHIDISYSLVASGSVYILVEGERIDPVFTKSDLRGDLVAKFSLSEIKEIVPSTGKFLTFELYGYTIDDQGFCGVDNIRFK